MVKLCIKHLTKVLNTVVTFVLGGFDGPGTDTKMVIQEAINIGIKTQ